MIINEGEVRGLIQRIQYKVRTKFPVDISIGEGVVTEGQTLGYYLRYVVQAETNKGTKFEVAEALPLICDVAHINAELIADTIDFRVNTITPELNKKGV